MYATHFPSKKNIVVEFTDAGPGVDMSNFEVRFRMAEIKAAQDIKKNKSTQNFR